MKERRRVLKMTQNKLAELAETSTQYIGLIENQKKLPSLEMVERIAEGLEIDPPELFSMDSFPVHILTEYKRDILTLFGKAADEIVKKKSEQLEGRTGAGKPGLVLKFGKREPLINRRDTTSGSIGDRI
jgi:transcriptional regulator with XRE-family HTH domain